MVQGGRLLTLLLIMGLAHLSLLMLESLVCNEDHALADENELDYYTWKNDTR